MMRPPLRSILYVEDNENIRALAKIALERIGGFTLRMCESGIDALAAIESGFEPDLLLLDVMLPGMDGPTILGRLREMPQTSHTPAIFMTAKAQSAEIEHLMSLGALGVITKPFQPTLLSKDIQRFWNSAAAPAPARSEIQAKLDTLRTQFRDMLPSQLEALRQCLAQARQAASADQWNALHHLLHGLSGSAGSFGFEELGLRARRIEELLKSSIAAGTVENTGAAVIGAADDFLRWCEHNLVPAAPAAPAVQERPPAFPLVPVQSQADRLLYLVCSAPGEDSIATQLVHFGYQIASYRSIDDLDAAVAACMPLSIVVDVDTQAGMDYCCATVSGIRAQRGGDLCPVIFLSAHGDFFARLAAARAGIDGYFVQPVDVTLLTERLSELTKQCDDTPYRVLIVDDDLLTAEHCQTVLQGARIEAAIVNRPEEIFAALEKYRPELIMMDLYMPDCSGADLAKLIRQDRSYLDIPIVFLSSEHNLDRQTEAVQAGADYFLTKPITPARLVSALSSRAERYRALRSLIMRDSQTGLYNHSAIKEHLQREISRARRSGTALAIAMIDLDHFKRVNDLHGHLVGDQVIRSLARIMQARFRRADIVGRYGGEEFLAILPGTSAAAAIGVLDDVREAFSRIRHRTAGADLSATFSAGVASLDAREDGDALIRAADAFLYRAKDQGRNCVVGK